MNAHNLYPHKSEVVKENARWLGRKMGEMKLKGKDPCGRLTSADIILPDATIWDSCLGHSSCSISLRMNGQMHNQFDFLVRIFRNALVMSSTGHWMTVPELFLRSHK